MQDALDHRGQCLERGAFLAYKFVAIIDPANAGDDVTQAALGVVSRHPCPTS